MLIPKYSNSDRTHFTKHIRCIDDKRHYYSRIITIINKNKKYKQSEHEQTVNDRAYQFVKFGLRVEWRCCMIAAIQYNEHNQTIYQTLLSNLYFANNDYSNDYQWADIVINSNIHSGDSFWTTIINIPYFYRNNIRYMPIDTSKPYNIPLMLASDSYINERHQRLISYHHTNYANMVSQTVNMYLINNANANIRDIIKNTQYYTVISSKDLHHMRQVTRNDFTVIRQFDHKTYSNNRLIGLILTPKFDIQKYNTTSQYNRAFMRSIIAITRNLHSEWRCAQFAMNYNIQNYSPTFLCNQEDAMADFDISIILTQAHGNMSEWIASIEISGFYKQPPIGIESELQVTMIQQPTIRN